MTPEPATSVPEATATPVPTDTPLPTDTPVPPLQLGVIRVSSPVSPSSTAEAVIQTEPGARCGIVVRYRSGPSTAQGLEAKTADGAGQCRWEWTVGPSTTPGTYSIELSVTLGQRSNRLNTEFTVQ